VAYEREEGGEEELPRFKRVRYVLAGPPFHFTLSVCLSVYLSICPFLESISRASPSPSSGRDRKPGKLAFIHPHRSKIFCSPPPTPLSPPQDQTTTQAPIITSSDYVSTEEILGPVPPDTSAPLDLITKELLALVPTGPHKLVRE
jgi:hypothetical protein